MDLLAIPSKHFAFIFDSSALIWDGLNRNSCISYILWRSVADKNTNNNISVEVQYFEFEVEYFELVEYLEFEVEYIKIEVENI